MQFDDLPRGLPGNDAKAGAAPRALWMNPETLTAHEFWQYSPDKIVLGAANGKMLGISDNRHLMTVAGSRAGKGTSAIIPNLLAYPGSVLVIDPKGENATLTAERRGQGRGIAAGGLGHDVFVIDPFGVADVPDEYRAGYNPFVALDPDNQNFIDDCDSLADALVVAAPGKETDHWNSSAKMILRGFVAWVAAAPDIATRNLAELWRLLHLPPETQDGKGFDDLLIDIAFSPDVAAGIPAAMAGALVGMGPDERGSVLSTVRQNITFLSSPPMAQALNGDLRSVDLERWKLGGVSVYLCLPAGRMPRHNRFFRLFLNQLLGAVERSLEQPRHPALMILDEMHVLGRMASLETAAGLMAGYGVRLWSIWQDLSQLKDLYRTRWETFMGNAGLLQFFGLNDLTTLEYVSKKLGTSSILSVSKSEISQDQAARGFSGQSKSIQETPLLSPDEVAYFFSRQSGNQLIFYPGADPIFMNRVPYMDDFYREMLP